MDTYIYIFRLALGDRQLSPSEFLELGLETLAFCRSVGLLGNGTMRETEDLLAGLIEHWGMDPKQLLRVGSINEQLPLTEVVQRLKTIEGLLSLLEKNKGVLNPSNLLPRILGALKQLEQAYEAWSISCVFDIVEAYGPMSVTSIQQQLQWSGMGAAIPAHQVTYCLSFLEHQRRLITDTPGYQSLEDIGRWRVRLITD